MLQNYAREERKLYHNSIFVQQENEWSTHILLWLMQEALDMHSIWIWTGSTSSKYNTFHLHTCLKINSKKYASEINEAKKIKSKAIFN